MDQRRGENKLDKIRQLTTLANELNISLTHLSIAWCLKNPNVSTVILGASRLTQLNGNLSAANALKNLTPEVMGLIEGVVDNKPAAAQHFGQ
jgi:aryl-alcohol dehydrogenase-like predicted oxidoreductase